MFITIEEAIAVVKQYAGIPVASFQWDESLLALLEGSRGLESYRPYIVAAFHLWSASGAVRQQLYEGDGAKFLKPEDLTPTITGLLATQEAIDGQLTGIPESWSIIKVRLLCGCSKVATTVTAGGGSLVI
ncbi:MAG: hypothetical protein KME60_03280 [Cyanomargarita calcarea GSE-NOS-MK-12-04C]|jgi:hypothetical protein|uniref:Uncharacterized protein n=1 Tax=Cyanomargarita calcarea GSE-NOS-MK-12-04C TaxID=2839659 RepID=A0A951UQJ8_9CYAN|nr:hypothetical protein [Cyanomargarita calcarea GSE-NOS-MK-12-04C]